MVTITGTFCKYLKCNFRDVFKVERQKATWHSSVPSSAAWGPCPHSCTAITQAQNDYNPATPTVAPHFLSSKLRITAPIYFHSPYTNQWRRCELRLMRCQWAQIRQWRQSPLFPSSLRELVNIQQLMRSVLFKILQWFLIVRSINAQVLAMALLHSSSASGPLSQTPALAPLHTYMAPESHLSKSWVSQITLLILLQSPQPWQPPSDHRLF